LVWFDESMNQSIKIKIKIKIDENAPQKKSK